jgi:glycosyltransferase involved in cell wall biosynthesis
MNGNTEEVVLSIGIPAHNEGKSLILTIRSLRDALNSMNITFEIIVVASGCEDNTVDMAREALNGMENYVIITEKERKGKSAALNRIADKAKGNILIFCDADVLVDSEALHLIYKAFINDDSLALTYARVKVLKGRSRLWTIIGEKSADALDAYRSLEGDRGIWMVCGHLYAIRASEWSCIPDGIVTDDVYIGLLFLKEKQKIRYLRDALVYISYPQTLSDYFVQKIRNRLARRQIAPSTDYALMPPVRWIGMDFLLYERISSLKHFPIILLDGLLVLIAELLWKFKYRQSQLWQMITTSKLSRD